MPDDAPVRIEGGLVAGRREGAVRAFLGLPYAAPPLGPLRWKAPAPVTPWSGVRRADRFAPICLQPGRAADSVYAEYAGEQPMSEDCLYLNVWTAAPDAQARWPVMVWIHGGAFQQGSGSNPVFVRGDLAAQGVVLVTFNYRLGPFGFMAHPELDAARDGASANHGLLDMAAALRWVRHHIAAFGGDPERVTVFGQSAGAAGVVDLMASAQARGLFDRAIAHSFGVAEMATLATAREQGLDFARRAGAADLAALRALDAQALLDAYLAQPTRFMPVVDGDFIARPVCETFAAGTQQAVPLLAGWNADEGSAFPATASAAAFRAELAQRFGSDADAALRLYPADDDAQARRSSRQLTGDGLFAWGVWRAACAQTRLAPTYLYHFEHAQPFAPGQRYREADPATDLGAFHSAEYPYVFGTTGVLTRDWGDADRRLTRLMQARWLAFARAGNPDVAGLPDWPRFDPSRPTVMRLSAEPALVDVPRREHLEFIDRSREIRC